MSSVLEADVRVRPLRDWMVVKLDPLPGVSRGGIILPQGTSGEERVRTGTVLRVGPGRSFWSSTLKKELVEPVGVAPGDKVAFFRENLEHQQGKQLVRVLQELEEDVGLIRAGDVLYVVEAA